jgi:uncharacterized glyoxalase superfamily protein PhnB
MTTGGPIPNVRCDEVLPTLAVGDVDAGIDHYRDVLGFEELWRYGEPTAHAGIRFGTVEIHLSAKPPNPGGGWLYFVVSDVDALRDALRERGADIVHPPQDQPWGMREMAVRDLVGNGLTFASPAVAREPKLPIEREGVSVRLEKRLLAVVRDLADHKDMSLPEMLEETLLHTFEVIPGGGIASPHTPETLRLIEELKQKHGLDYETHASYRFVEERREG